MQRPLETARTPAFPDRFPLRRLRSVVCATLICVAVPTSLVSPASAQIIVGPDRLIQVNEQQLLSWVFGSSRPGEDPLERARNELEVQIDLIALAGDLSEPQRDKLRLAGRGDLHRFFNRFESLKRNSPSGSIPQDEWQKIWQQAQPLQARFNAGLHGRGSLYAKTIRSTLDAEQLAQYEQLETERNRKHYHAIVKATVATIDRKIPLTAEQRRDLIDRIMEKTEPPVSYGQRSYQFYVVLYRMSTIEEDLKPLFLENEWRVMRDILQRGRGMEHVLRQMEEAELDD